MNREEIIEALRNFNGDFSVLGKAADMLEADGVPVGYFNGRFGSVSEPDGVWAEITVLDALPTAGAKFYTAPQPAIQERKPLTDGQIRNASLQAGMQEHYMGFHSGFIRFARAIEAAHGITENKP